MLKRSITGLILGLTVIACILYSSFSAVALILIILLGSSYEWYKHLVSSRAAAVKALFLFFTVIATLLIMLMSFQKLDPNIEDFKWLLVGPCLAILIMVAMGALFLTPSVEMATSWPVGIFYIHFPMLLGAMFLLQDFEHHKCILLGLIVMNWSNDTFAYLIGRLLGKTPLAPSISPNKTVEGSTGGLVATVIASFLVNQYLLEQSYPIFQLILLGVGVWLGGTIGDLYESKIKRNLGIKDSGSILPGHGGFLDRFDSFFYIVVVGIFVLLN